LRNVTVFADAQVDRSPCGTGTSALLAQGVARGRLAVGDEIRNASITGAVFRGRVEETTRLGDEAAIIPSVAGTAAVTGYHTFVVDARDPLGEGFLLGR
jgi:proline racemase